MSIYYQDDYVTLFHGDCLTEHREWLTADVLVTDPPYGMAYIGDYRSSSTGNRSKKVEIHGDQTLDARDSVLEAWGARPAVVFGTWRMPRPKGMKNLVVWDKGNSPGVGNTNIPWGLSHEEIYILGIWPSRMPGQGGSRGGSVVRCNTLAPGSQDRPDHPTPKPVPLMERLIEKCPPGTIADPFEGSGSTLLAAKNLGRKVIGVELEEKYCEIIAKRCAQESFDLGGL